MQTQYRILQAMVVLMALMLITGIADAQKKKTKKTSTVTKQVQDTINRAVIEEEPYPYGFVSVEVEPHPIEEMERLSR
jgi:Zn-dependent M32 family carboxypeptidase